MEVDSMGKYIAKRLLWIIPVVLGVTVMVFTIMYLTPGADDPGVKRNRGEAGRAS